jgi:uncharacterized protein with PQ loop repeat
MSRSYEIPDSVSITIGTGVWCVKRCMYLFSTAVAPQGLPGNCMFLRSDKDLLSPEAPIGIGCRVAGQALGYLSMVLYLGSRFSQIYKNWHRKSTEGLAMAMFMAAIMANVCYGSSIVVRTYSMRQLLDSLPWILGSFGTVGLDICILYQVRGLAMAAGFSSRWGYCCVSGVSIAVLGDNGIRAPLDRSFEAGASPFLMLHGLLESFDDFSGT